MAEDPCAPYAACENLDGQLLINRTADGPALAVEPDEIPFGPVTMRGATLHAYIRWTYQQTWSTKEACLGPARSVIGLAPGETITIELIHRQSVDTTRLVREAADRSSTSSRTERRPTPTGADRTPARPSAESSMSDKLVEAQRDKLLEEREKQQSQRHDGQVELQALHYTELGSPFIEAIVGAIVGAVTGSHAQKKADADEAKKHIQDQLEHEDKGGAGSINADTNRRIGEIVDEVSRSESQSSASETTTTTRESFERRVVRTFSNPYRDRSLELRFFPVFRRFEVTTSMLKAEPGILLRPGLIDFAVANPRARMGAFVESDLSAKAVAATAAADPGEEREGAAALRTAAVADHLTANAALYTRRFVRHLDQGGSEDALLTPFVRMLGTEQTPAAARAANVAGVAAHAESGAGSLADGLAWSRASVRNGEIHVPLADAANWPTTWRREGGAHLDQRIAATIDNAAWRARWTTTRDVHLFMGTHVEAVAGTCVLADVPES